ncbi:MAG: HEAT repeat domain-containing protein [Abditibacteriales bacterium]|nr:HEAT repeat domain-containing protein [Abditibacteriales bacterium]MDW8366087.1 HEAT repeat domain-containing protein [Abditibacteriales bacterium]
MDEVERLLRVLQRGDARDRRRAADALGARGDVRAVEPLCLALHDEEFSVRKHAGEAIVRIGAPAVEMLCKTLCEAVGDFNFHMDGWEFACKVIGKLNLRHRELLPLLRKAHARIAELHSSAEAILDAIEKIERSTEATKSLPRPAAAPPPDTTTLPRPVGAPAFDVDKLPRPAD